MSILKFLYRQANFLNVHYRKILCSALVLCHLDYASSAWYTSLSNNLKNKLQITQNKCIRYIHNLGPRSHVGFVELENTGLLSVKYRMSQLRLNLIHKVFYGEAPTYLNEHFNLITHNYNTRFSNKNFLLPNAKNQICQTFYYNSIRDWNGLPLHIKSIQNSESFKFNVKKFLMDMARRENNSIFLYY